MKAISIMTTGMFAMLHVCTLSSITISFTQTTVCIISCSNRKWNSPSFHYECVWLTACGPGFSTLPVLVITWLREEEVCVSVCCDVNFLTYDSPPWHQCSGVLLGWRPQWNPCQTHAAAILWSCDWFHFPVRIFNADSWLFAQIVECIWFDVEAIIHSSVWHDPDFDSHVNKAVIGWISH